MPLAEGCRAISILLKCFCYAGGFLGHLAVVTGKAGGQLHDDSGVYRVVVAASNHRRAGWRTQSCGMEAVVTQSFISKFLQIGHVHRATEGTGMAKPHIVKENQ